MYGTRNEYFGYGYGSFGKRQCVLEKVPIDLLVSDTHRVAFYGKFSCRVVFPLFPFPCFQWDFPITNNIFLCVTTFPEVVGDQLRPTVFRGAGPLLSWL